MIDWISRLLAGIGAIFLFIVLALIFVSLSNHLSDFSKIPDRNSRIMNICGVIAALFVIASIVIQVIWN